MMDLVVHEMGSYQFPTLILDLILRWLDKITKIFTKMMVKFMVIYTGIESGQKITKQTNTSHGN